MVLLAWRGVEVVLDGRVGEAAGGVMVAGLVQQNSSDARRGAPWLLVAAVRCWRHDVAAVKARREHDAIDGRGAELGEDGDRRRGVARHRALWSQRGVDADERAHG